MLTNGRGVLLKAWKRLPIEIPPALSLWSHPMRLNPFQRYQPGLTVADVYPTQIDTDGARLCQCGCGRKPPTGRHRYASSLCQQEVLRRFKVLKGDGLWIRQLVWERDKGVCRGCGLVCVGGAPTSKEHRALQLEEIGRSRKRQPGVLYVQLDQWHADHIVPVERGGGACELDGYQTLCVECHRQKSSAEASARTTTPAHPPT